MERATKGQVMYMPGVVDPKVDRWLLSTVPPRDGAFGAVEEEAIRQRIPCIGPYEGHVLALLVTMCGATRVLEIGTATGYSALWLAKGATVTGGQVTTVEQDPHRAAAARVNVARCGYADTVQVVEGDGFAFLEGTTTMFDFIFLDMVSALEDLRQVDRLFAGCVAHLASGGVLVSDNALHAGQVAADRVPESAQRYARYNQLALRHPELDTALLPVRDGLAMSRRRQPAPR